MKPLLFFLLMMTIFTTTINAQQLKADTLSTLKLYDYYKQKRNMHNTIGWVCLGSGLTLAGVGLLEDIGSAFKHGSSTKGDGIAVAGEVVALASIPFFVIANHDKKKASFYFKKESVSINNRPLSKTNFTSLSVAIKL